MKKFFIIIAIAVLTFYSIDVSRLDVDEYTKLYGIAAATAAIYVIQAIIAAKRHRKAMMNQKMLNSTAEEIQKALGQLREESQVNNQRVQNAVFTALNNIRPQIKSNYQGTNGLYQGLFESVNNNYTSSYTTNL